MPILVKAFIVVLLVLRDAASSYLLNVEVREPVAIPGWGSNLGEYLTCFCEFARFECEGCEVSQDKVRKIVQGNYVRARFSLSFGLVVLMNGCEQVLPCTREATRGEGSKLRRGYARETTSEEEPVSHPSIASYTPRLRDRA